MNALTRYTVYGFLTALVAMVFLWAGTAIAGDDESAGNNLSYPVIWAEGVEKTLRTPTDFTAGPNPTPVTEEELTGKWWYQWGTNGAEHEVTPASCPPDPDEGNVLLNPDKLQLCDNGESGTVDLNKSPSIIGADNPLPLVKAYLQKETFNIWQAGTSFGTTDGTVGGDVDRVEVDWIDWGDNLESVDWYTRSQVRAEVVLYKYTSMLEYEMRHVDGWGDNEVHGLAVDQAGASEGPGTQATVYSHCARLTIQKLLVDRDDPLLAPGDDPLLDNLVWETGTGWTENVSYTGDPLISDVVVFNRPVYEAGDGPGYYNAEINVKGKVIYGYTWNVRNLNDLTGDPKTAAGDYRITFSFDETCGTDVIELNTFFEDGTTEILVPFEEEVAAALAEETDGTGGGGVPVIDFTNNLTYIDVRILERNAGEGGEGGGNQYGKDKK